MRGALLLAIERVRESAEPTGQARWTSTLIELAGGHNDHRGARSLKPAAGPGLRVAWSMSALALPATTTRSRDGAEPSFGRRRALDPWTRSY